MRSPLFQRVQALREGDQRAMLREVAMLNGLRSGSHAGVKDRRGVDIARRPCFVEDASMTAQVALSAF